MRACASLLVLLVLSGCAGQRAPLFGGARPTPSTSPRLSAAPVLSVVAWNLDAGRGDVAALAADLPAADYVLLLQEAIEADITAFARARGLHLFFAGVRDIDDGRVLGNAIVSTLPLSDTRVVALPRERQPRSAAAATIAVRGQQMFVVSVHLENRVSWWRGGLISDTARGRQAKALIDALPAGTPGIAGGDLNTWLGPAEPAWRLLAQRFPDTTPLQPSSPTFHDRLVLDHVFFDLPDGWRADRVVMPERYGSNHHPVLGLVF
jgi:endonuclease/exonuclease/phosphatase family metal-dependent hydrolase